MNVCRFRVNPFVVAMLFGAALLVYVRTLCPTVYWEDAGELITVSHVLGIAHPPGHPLYTIIGHLFTLLPWGSIAARVNFMSSFFGAFASALVYPVVLLLLSREETDKRLVQHCAGATAALFAAFGLTLWDQAVVAETSTLHAFFFMLLLVIFLLVLRASDSPSFSRRLFLFSFVYGLSLTNHVAGVFLIPAFGVWALLKARSKPFSFRNAGLSVVFFFLGLSIYLYLPIRSAQNPIIDWGNPETFSNFWWVITAGQFKSNVFRVPGVTEVLQGSVRHMSNMRENFLGVGLAFIVVGIWNAFRMRKDFLSFALVAVGTLFFVTLNPAFITAYFIPALLLLAIFLGLGANAVACLLVELADNSSLRRAISMTVCVALLMSPLLPLLRHYSMNDKSNYYRARDYGMRILEALPPNAMFFTIDLNAIFTIWYLMYCEGIRTDVAVIEPTWLTNSGPMREEILRRYPGLRLPEIGEKILAGERMGVTPLYDKDLLYSILRKNSEVRPVFWGAAPVVPSIRPRGLVYEFVRDEDNVLDEETIRCNTEFWEGIADEFHRTPGLTRDRVASLIYPENLRHQGYCFSAFGRQQLARWALELALKMNPAHAPAWLHLGELCESNGEHEDALRFLDQAANLDYRVRPRALYCRGRILCQLGEYDRAVEALLAVAEEESDFSNVHNMLGALYLKMSRIDKAEDELRTEISLNPGNAAAHANLAQILIQRGELDEVEEILAGGVEADAKMWQNFYFLAVVNSLRGNQQKAADLLNKAIELGGEGVLRVAEQDANLKRIAVSGKGEN